MMATRPPTGLSLLQIIGRILAGLLLFAIIVFMFTDAWPWMHQVFVQQSWRPVCARPDGSLYFCEVWGP